MSSNKFVRQIRREAKSHPAKAAVLGILAMVAVYYWTSLAWSWVSHEEKGHNKAKIAATADLAANLDPQKILVAELAKTEQQQADRPQADWQQIIQWMESDPRTIIADVLPGRANAFEIEEKLEGKNKQPKQLKETVHVAKPDPTPQQLDIELSSTLVGSHGGVALINGKTYRLGHMVSSDKDQSHVQFKLSEIHDHHIVLTRKDKQYKLMLPEKQTSGNISINIKE